MAIENRNVTFESTRKLGLGLNTNVLNENRLEKTTKIFVDIVMH